MFPLLVVAQPSQRLMVLLLLPQLQLQQPLLSVTPLFITIIILTLMLMQDHTLGLLTPCQAMGLRVAPTGWPAVAPTGTLSASSTPSRQ